MSDESAEDTFYLNLLETLCARNFFNEKNTDLDALKPPQSSQEEFVKLCDNSSQILKTVGAATMDSSQLQAFLTSRVKHRDPDHRLSEQQSKIITKFWKMNKGRIVETLLNRTRFYPVLKNVNWRLDICTTNRMQYKNITVILLQINLQNFSTDFKVKTKSIEMELDMRGINKLFTSMKEIDTQIQSFVQLPK